LLISFFKKTICETRNVVIQVIVNGISTVDEFENFCTDIADVIITIDDVNDNPPALSQSIYRFNILENLSAGVCNFLLKYVLGLFRLRKSK